ncbi:interleukin-21 receptor-like [Xyrichtys novacula]|nr:interleukin-21 receptor-like [Xyrichtys novacula]
MDDSYRSVCKVTSNDNFLSDDQYAIKLVYESGSHNLEEGFEPSQNIQPTPPYDVEVNQSAEGLNITWKSRYEDHKYLVHGLDYEVSLQPSKIRTLHFSKLQSASVPRLQLKSDTIYCIKVRSITNIEDYKGIWSEWSPPVCLKYVGGDEQDNILLILMKSLGPTCVAVAVLVFVFNSPAARMKIKTLSYTPSPAPFFKPLYQQHEGNLQDWLSPKGKYLLTYKPEEILTADTVVVVPKPTTTKDPEENQDLHNPLLSQLMFTQCQTSYIGLPGTHDPTPPVTMVCPGQTSYTQLPCSVWGVSVGEVEVISTPVKDVLNISRADSGCSIEDLTLSFDCSLPNSPVDVGPPPCSCADYCILNKTADGFAPVLVSKGSSHIDSPDSQQQNEN